RLRTELLVEAAVIADVVAVRARRARGQGRRRIAIADAQPRKVADQDTTLTKVETALKLQPIRASRQARAQCATPRPSTPLTREEPRLRVRPAGACRRESDTSRKSARCTDEHNGVSEQ